MRIVGVIDIRNGRAVHARGGMRASYEPVRDVAGVDVRGGAHALARVYVDQLGVRELYVADLDAITGGILALNGALLRDLTSLGAPMMVDAGVASARDAQAVLDCGAAAVIVGLETLPSFVLLDETCATVGGSQVVFSVDLRNGELIAAPNVADAWSASDVAGRAATAGVGGIVVLDLARVGTGAGVDLELIRAVRASAPSVALFAGGGVRSNADITELANVGCDGVLVATALHRGLVQEE